MNALLFDQMKAQSNLWTAHITNPATRKESSFKLIRRWSETCTAYMERTNDNYANEIGR